MPKLACPCGYVFDLVSVPCPYEYQLVPEATVDAVADLAARPAPLTEQDLYDAMDQGSHLAWLCPECGRILLEKSGESVVRSYAPEPDQEQPPQ